MGVDLASIQIIRLLLDAAGKLIPWWKNKPRRGKLSWQKIEKDVFKLKDKMVADRNYRPNYIVCVGRAGAFVGGLLSHQFDPPVIPIIVLTFDYKIKKQRNGEIILQEPVFLSCGEIKEELKNVLVLGADVISGQTMRKCLEVLAVRKVRGIKTACLYRSSHAEVTPTYFVEKCSARPYYPWSKLTFDETHYIEQQIRRLPK